MGHLGGLLPVDGPRAGEQKFFNGRSGGEIQNPAGAADYGVEHFVGRFLVELGAGFGCRMDDVLELSVRKGE
jgi:hypothetical protein